MEYCISLLSHTQEKKGDFEEYSVAERGLNFCDFRLNRCILFGTRIDVGFRTRGLWQWHVYGIHSTSNGYYYDNCCNISHANNV